LLNPKVVLAKVAVAAWFHRTSALIFLVPYELLHMALVGFFLQFHSISNCGAGVRRAIHDIFSSMENELFQHKTKKLQKLLDEVHERIAEVQQANEDIAAMLKPSVSLSLLQGGGEQADTTCKPKLMIVYPLANN
jgi:hypothetical protein